MHALPREWWGVDDTNDPRGVGPVCRLRAGGMALLS